MTFPAGALRGVVWTKALRSKANGACVEVAEVDGMVAVHDSKEPDGPALSYTRTEWEAFIDGVKKGEFDRFGQG